MELRLNLNSTKSNAFAIQLREYIVKLAVITKSIELTFSKIKNIEIMKKQTLFFNLILGTFLVLFIGCEKTSETEKSDLSIITSKIISITQNSAICGGTIISSASIEIKDRGVCWSVNANPTILDSKTTDSLGIGSFVSKLTNLTANTTYHVRAYMSTKEGLIYGADSTFKTLATDSTIIKDYDGNIYHSVKIGTQIWMVENLKVTHYVNGDPITKISNKEDWNSIDGGATWNSRKTGAYCNYLNNDSLANIYGHLYNWYVVKDSRKICPSGWHVPTEQDFRTLISYLDGEKVAGGKLKEAGFLHWLSPNTGANNSSGFTALPSGGRGFHGSFWDNIADETDVAIYWSSTSISDSTASELYILGNSEEVIILPNNSDTPNPLQDGLSIRCIKD